jgi:hypothetical protein
LEHRDVAGSVFILSSLGRPSQAIIDSLALEQIVIVC